MPRWMIKLASLFSNDAKVYLEQWGTEFDIDHTKAERDFGMKFIEPRDSIKEMIHSMIANGALKEIK